MPGKLVRFRRLCGLTKRKSGFIGRILMEKYSSGEEAPLLRE